MKKEVVAGIYNRWYFNVTVYQKYSILGVNFMRKLAVEQFFTYRGSLKMDVEAVENAQAAAQRKMLKKMGLQNWSITYSKQDLKPTLIINPGFM